MPLTPEQSLVETRALWRTLMGIQLGFMLMPVGVGWLTYQRATFNSELWPVYAWSFLLVASICFLCVWMRDETYKANWVGNVITPVGYQRAHLYIGLVLIVASLLGFFLPYEVQAPARLIFVVLMAFMSPNGKPMQDHPVRL